MINRILSLVATAGFYCRSFAVTIFKQMREACGVFVTAIAEKPNATLGSPSTGDTYLWINHYTLIETLSDLYEQFPPSHVAEYSYT